MARPAAAVATRDGADFPRGTAGPRFPDRSPGQSLRPATPRRPRGAHPTNRTLSSCPSSPVGEKVPGGRLRGFPTAADWIRWDDSSALSRTRLRRQAPIGAGTHRPATAHKASSRSEEHTSELQSQSNLVCRLLLEKKKKI